MKHVIHAMFAGETWLERIVKTALVPFCLFAIIPIGMFFLPGMIKHGLQVLLRRAAQEKSKELGLSDEHYVAGTDVGLVVDKDQQKLLFISFKDHAVHSFSDVLGWEWQYVESGNTKSDNFLVFKMNDLKVPLIKVGKLLPDHAEVAHHQLGLLLNPT